jgi:hypothetical protein
LFLDPQRDIGVPLILQNKNPMGGGVIAAFNIIGAVLENDKDMFRYLRKCEINWSNRLSSVQALVNTASNAGSDHEEAMQRVSARPNSGIHEDEALQRHIYIDWRLSPSDIESLPIRSYLAYKMSTGEISFIKSESDKSVTLSDQSIPIHLPVTFDYEIVTFAPIIYSEPVLHSNDIAMCVDNIWISVIGATDMFNPGGAVLLVDVDTIAQESVESASHEASRIFRIHLLGSGRYSIVSNVKPSKIVYASNMHISSGVCGNKESTKDILFSYERSSSFSDFFLTAGVIEFSIPILTNSSISTSSLENERFNRQNYFSGRTNQQINIIYIYYN